VKHSNKDITDLLVSLDSTEGIDSTKLDEIIHILESTIPSEFQEIFSVVGSDDAKPSFWELLKNRLISSGVSDENSQNACRLFFKLLALLRVGEDRYESIRFGGIEVPDQLDPEDPIEYALRRLGHKHDQQSRRGMIDEIKAEKVYKILSIIWSSSPEFHDWLVSYLGLRIVRNLMHFDLFYVMHGRMPRYRETKILAYLLMIVARERFQPAMQLVMLAHRLYYSIIHDCRVVFATAHSVEDLESTIRKTLYDNARALSAIEQRIPAKSDNYANATLRILYRFFRQYIEDLAEAGKLHVIIWSLPMFEEIKSAFQSIEHFQKRDFSVLIIGETGTGKESIAKLFLKSIGAPYVAINCAGASWSVVVQDLFGYGQNAEALIRKLGAVFLDEIEKSHLDTQGGLLRFLDKPTGEYRAAGKITPLQWNGLVIASATELIYNRIIDGTFLPDLFWRFDIRVRIAPLREHMIQSKMAESLLSLALSISQRKFNLPGKLMLSPQQYEALRHYTWPGNLRELLEMCDALTAEAKKDIQRYTDRGEEYILQDEAFEKVFGQFQAIARRLGMSLHWG